MQVELKAVFKGKVQGVFFRSSVKTYAQHLNLSGIAQNLSDGSVLVKAVGEKEQLEKLLEKIKHKPGFGKIEAMDVSYQVAEDNYSGFSVV